MMTMTLIIRQEDELERSEEEEDYTIDDDDIDNKAGG